MDVPPKNFLQIILAAEWLERHSFLSLNQQRRPLPSVLFLFYVSNLHDVMVGKHGWVQYFCKTALREATGLSHKNQQVFIVMNPIDLNMEPAILAVRDRERQRETERETEIER